MTSKKTKPVKAEVRPIARAIVMEDIMDQRADLTDKALQAMPPEQKLGFIQGLLDSTASYIIGSNNQISRNLEAGKPDKENRVPETFVYIKKNVQKAYNDARESARDHLGSDDILRYDATMIGQALPAAHTTIARGVMGLYTPEEVDSLIRKERRDAVEKYKKRMKIK